MFNKINELNLLHFINFFFQLKLNFYIKFQIVIPQKLIIQFPLYYYSIYPYKKKILRVYFNFYTLSFSNEVIYFRLTEI